MAPMISAVVAVEERPVLGELAMQVLSGCIVVAAAGSAAPWAGRGQTSPSAGRGHDTRSVARRAVRRGSDARSCDDAPDGPPTTRVAALATRGPGLAVAWLASRRPWPRPTARSRPSRRPSATLLFGWTFEPLPTLGIARRPRPVVVGGPPGRPRRIRRTRCPRRGRSSSALGMLALAFALLSGIDRYDTTLFSIHMVQHILLVLVAAPLIALAAPITLLLRVATPRRRRRWILPVLHSRVVRVLAFPVVAWLLFAGVMWASHFSPLFDAALEDPLVHDLEHAPVPRDRAAVLVAGRRRWTRRRGGCPTRRAPCTSSCRCPRTRSWPWSSSARRRVALPALRARPCRTWGPTALEDQQLAAGIMWIAGDAIFLARCWSSSGLDAARGARRAAAGPRAAVELAGSGAARRSLAERRAARAARTLSPGAASPGSRGTRAGSTLPPLTTATVGPRRS